MLGKQDQIRILKKVRRGLVRQRDRNAEHADCRRAHNELAAENHFRGIVIGFDQSIREIDTALAYLLG